MLSFLGIRKSSAKPDAAIHSEISPEAGQRSPVPSEASSNATGPPQSPDLVPVVNVGDAEGYALEELPNRLFDPSTFVSFIKTIPPKTLHSYVLSSIPHATPLELHALSTFFATLEPPPHLHCVRCHKSFTEVENDDRSCVVAHDDESAEVERVKNHIGGSMYQTIWNCCNKTVDGDGDQGPPDGFCYEGKHTTDVKRARFRADSTIHDDKLVSCTRRGCFKEKRLSEGGRRSERAGTRKKLKEDSSDDEALMNEAVEEDSDGDVESKKHKRKPRKSATSRKKDAEPMEVDGADARSNNGSADNGSAASSRGKRKLDTMQSKPAATKQPPSSKAANRSDNQTVLPEAIDGNATIDDSTSISNLHKEAQPKPKARKPRKSRKSGGSDGGVYKPPKDDVEDSEDENDVEEPKTRRRKVA